MSIEGVRSVTCLVDECLSPVRCRGLCNRHYQRQLKGLVLEATPKFSRSGVCTVDGCDRKRDRAGLCSMHYDRSRKTDLCPECGDHKYRQSIRCGACSTRHRQASLPTEKTCSRCREIKPIGSFGLRIARQGAAKYRARCRECEAIDRRTRDDTKFLAGAGRRAKTATDSSSTPYLGLRRYANKLGIEWRLVLESYPLDNRCQICGRTPQEANPSGRYVRLTLDHDHNTGRLRGFLCGPCNTGIGFFQDDPILLETAINYLRER